MTETRARQIANVVLAAAAAGTAFMIVRDPPLRRTAWRLARIWATGPLAVWAATEVHRAWEQSGR
ncbi:MAG: hypothetical protein DMF86_11300 [Acidobacteria bacterium]|nr:MAG: hypothetical protein DMF86_11300 [Acidobacteriota bacterium]